MSYRRITLGHELAADTDFVLTDKLCLDGMITSPVVERAFRTVLRERFVPEGTPLEVVYNDADSVAVEQGLERWRKC